MNVIASNRSNELDRRLLDFIRLIEKKQGAVGVSEMILRLSIRLVSFFASSSNDYNILISHQMMFHIHTVFQFVS